MSTLTQGICDEREVADTHDSTLTLALSLKGDGIIESPWSPTRFKLTNLGAIFTIIAGCGDFKRTSTNRFAVSDYAGDSRLSAVD